MPFSRKSSQHRGRIHVSCIAGRFFAIGATREAPWIGRKHPNFTQNGKELRLPSLTPPFSISMASSTLLDKWSARIDPTFYSWDQPSHLLTPLCVVPLPHFTPILISGIPVLISIPPLPACDRALSKQPLIVWINKHRVPWLSQPLTLGFQGLPIQSIEAELLASTSTRRCSRRQPLKYIELKKKRERIIYCRLSARDGIYKDESYTGLSSRKQGREYTQ